MREKILGFIIWVLYRCLWLTWKIEIIETPEMQKLIKNKTPFVIAHWHGDELALIHLSKRYRIATLSSKSKDGAIMTFVLGKLGAKVVRGSSSRGAVSGLLGLIKLIRKGYCSSFAVDGPKGPLHRAKPGILETSKSLKIPIICGGAAAHKAWVFEKAWNKAFLPKPFARVCIVWSAPWDLLPADSNPNDPVLLQKVEASINAAKRQALGIIAESAR